MKKKTTKADFKAFKDECGYWQEYFGIKGYCYIYTWEPMEATATCVADRESGSCVLSLTKIYEGEKITHEEICAAAFHEMLEALLFPIRDLMRQYYSEKIISCEFHPIIEMLTNTVFSDSYGKRYNDNNQGDKS